MAFSSICPTPSTVAEPATHCTYLATPPAARPVSLPPATPDYQATYQATITTNRGPIVIDLLNSKATCTVNSFLYLASKRPAMVEAMGRVWEPDTGQSAAPAADTAS